MNTYGADQKLVGLADLVEAQRAATTSRVVSLRLPSAVVAALQRSSADARLSVPDGLDWLLRNSFGNSPLLLPLTDCPDTLDAKLDVRIPPNTAEQLKAIAHDLKVPVSVYIRKLLYHFFVTKELKYVSFNGHYTLSRMP
jgi:hypothetical protein